MEAASKPFKSKYTSGRCPVCKRRILKDDLIVRLAGRVWWIEPKTARSGKYYQSYKTSDYVHAECLEELEEKDE